MESANTLVVLKFDDGSEWQGRIPEPVERYMAGMADEIQRLRAKQTEIERLREVERKALEQSEYIQKHGLTEWEMALKNAEIQRLRGALEAVEWVQDTGNGDYYCPWCDNNKLVGHHADCQRQTALEAAGGVEWLKLASRISAAENSAGIPV